MNILLGVADSGRGKRTGGAVLRCGSLTVPIALAYEGELHLGVRPEHVTVCGLGEGVGDAEVRVVEPLGSETLVHLDAGGQPVVARLPGLFEVPDGQRIGLRVDAKRLHFFDASGARVA